MTEIRIMLTDAAFYLRVVYSVPLLAHDTPESWTRGFAAQILRSREDSSEEPAGQITGWMVPVSSEPDVIQPMVAAKTQGEKCARLVRAVLDPVFSDYLEDLELSGLGEGILGVDEVSVRPDLWGYNIDRAALWHALRWLGHGWKVAVVALASLIEPAGDGSEEISPLGEDALAEGQEEVVDRWGELGFRPVPSSPGYLYLDLNRLPDAPPRIRRTRR